MHQINLNQHLPAPSSCVSTPARRRSINFAIVRWRLKVQTVSLRSILTWILRRDAILPAFLGLTTAAGAARAQVRTFPNHRYRVGVYAE